MTSKGRNAVRLETEIEKSREESRWNRVIELADQLKQRSPHQGKMQGFHSERFSVHRISSFITSRVYCRGLGRFSSW